MRNFEERLQQCLAENGRHLPDIIVTVWAYYARYFLTSARLGMKPMRRNIWPGAY